MKEVAAEKLRGVLSRMALGDAQVAAREDDERVTLEITGLESGLLIGKQGATLDSLQYLVNKMMSHGDERAEKPVVVDTEGYREQRAAALVELAERLAEKALKTRRPVAAAPMSPADRRTMHMALANRPGLTTQSEGEGASRRLMIIPTRDGGGAPPASDGGVGAEPEKA